MVSLPTLLVLLITFLQDPIGNSAILDKKYSPKYPFNSGKVTYEVSGNATGEVLLIWDRNGWREKEIQDLNRKQYGVTQPEKKWKMIDGDTKYEFDVLSGKGTKSTDQNFSDLMSYKSVAESNAAILGSQSGKILRKDSLLDLPVNVWRFERGSLKEMWEYEGIPLKFVYKYPSYSYEYSASEADFDYLPPTVNFELPSDALWEN